MPQTPEQHAGRATRRAPLWSQLLKLSLGLALVTWLLSSGRLDLERLIGLQLGPMLLGAVLGQGAMLLLPSLRWHLLLRAQGLDIDYASSSRILAAGYFTNTFVPGGLGIEGTRLYYLTRRYPGRAPLALSTQLADRFLGIAGLLTLGALGGGLLVFEQAGSLLWQLLLLALAVLAAVVVGLIAISSGMVSRFLGRWALGRTLIQACTATLSLRHAPGSLALAFGLSVLGHSAAALATFFAFHTYGESPSLAPVLGITPVVNLAAALPLAPLGLGISDSVAATLYPLVGLAAGAEVVMLLRLINLVLSLACGVAFLGQGPAGRGLSQHSEQRVETP